MQSKPTTARQPLISVIVPMFNEEENIKPFLHTLRKTIEKLAYRFEVIFIDDGSTDNSAKRVNTEAKKSTRQLKVRLVTLSRNFGKEVATTAGIHQANGSAAIIIDADLQHPLELIPKFIKKWKAGDDVVIGVRSKSAHSGSIKRIGSNAFYTIMNKISDTYLIPHSTDYRMIDRQVMDAFNAFTEKDRITRGLIDWLGFKRSTIEFESNERQYGTPSYTVRKLTKLATASMVGHSLMPLKFAGYIGLIFVIFFGAAGIGSYIELYLLNDPLHLALSGTALLAILLLFAIGIVLSGLGLISLYIATIHAEVSNRPLYIIRKDRTMN